MYIHLGANIVVNMKNVVGIFDLEATSISKTTRLFLAKAETRGLVINVSDELPKSFVVCEEGGKKVVYISQISAATLTKRSFFIDDIAMA